MEVGPNEQEVGPEVLTEGGLGAVRTLSGTPYLVNAVSRAAALHDMRRHTDDAAAYMRATVDFHTAIAHAAGPTVVVGL